MTYFVYTHKMCFSSPGFKKKSIFYEKNRFVKTALLQNIAFSIPDFHSVLRNYNKNNKIEKTVMFQGYFAK